jgi:dUTP pyrophosphatase
MILPKAEIKKLIQEQNMITDYLSLDEQLQPNGFDLTLDEIYDFKLCGMIGKNEKYLPFGEPIEPDELTNYHDLAGTYSYLFSINETVKLPLNVCAMTIQRSSIMRCGATTNIGFWDSGYNGKGYSLLNVMNQHGLRIQKGSRIMQMIFMTNTEETEGYHGQYQFEGIKTYHIKEMDLKIK